MQADCLNNISQNGENITPLEIITSVHNVFGRIDLDPASSELANKYVRADRYYDKEADGLSNPWVAEFLFINPPGKTMSKGTHRKATYWFNKLSRDVKTGDVTNVIYIIYRIGSIGSFPYSLIKNSSLIVTHSSSTASCVTNGRVSYYAKYNDKVSPMTSNTQSSVIGFVGNSDYHKRFLDEFVKYGLPMSCLV
jgi:hypothetical protein